MSRATRLSLNVTLRYEDLCQVEPQSAFEAIYQFVTQNELWPELATQVQFENCDTSQRNAISLYFMVESRHSEGPVVDIRDLTPPIEIPIVYVQSVNAELSLSTIDNTKKNANSFVKRGTFVQQNLRCNNHSAYVPLISNALDFFFGSTFGPRSHYIRQRMFLAPRLSDLAPGVFMPEFSRDIHARQKLVAPLSRILAEHKSTNDDCPSDPQRLFNNHMGSENFSFEERIWTCMVHQLRISRKKPQRNQRTPYEGMEDEPISSIPQSNVREADTLALLPLQNALLPSQAGCIDNAHTDGNSLIEACPLGSLPEIGIGMLRRNAESDSESFLDLFAEDNPKLNQGPYVDDELFFDLCAPNEDTAHRLLDSEMELCHTRDARLTTVELEYPYNESNVLTQQLACFDTGNRVEDQTWTQSQDLLIGQDLITHSSLYANPSYGIRSVTPQHEAYIDEEPTLLTGSLPPIPPSVLVDKFSQERASLNLHETCHSALPASNLILDPLIIDRMATQQRRESIFSYKGRWSLSGSKTSPPMNNQSYNKTPSRTSSIKDQAMISDRSITSSPSDEMLFDNFSFSRSSTLSSPWSVRDNEEMLFDPPSRASTAPTSAPSTLRVPPRRMSSLLRKLRSESESRSISDEEIISQQTSPVRSIDIKGRKALEDYV